MQNLINPFYAARNNSFFINKTDNCESIYVKLPQSPITASPVPHLTSLYHFSHAGEYGSRKYPGNCGGNLIKDLLSFFRPANVFDPMTGSGTCMDVCNELGIECYSSDIHQGKDACDASLLPFGQFDFIWLHPPYWRMKLYTNDERDLSRAATLDDFLKRLTLVIDNCHGALRTGGNLAILIGDYKDRECGFIPLTFWAKYIALQLGFNQHCTDIIRFNHGVSSSKKSYKTSFIPTLHEVCMIFKKGEQ